MAQTLIQKLASVDVGSVIAVMPRKNFKDPDFTPVGGTSKPITATVLAKNGNVLTLDLGQNMIFNFNVVKDITFKVLSTPAPKETTIAPKATPATVPTGPLTTFVLFFVSIFARTATKTQFLVRSQAIVEGTVESLRGIMQGLPTVDGATYVIWKTEDGKAKGGFNLTTWAGMTPATEWALVREESLPYIVAGTGSRSLKYASQAVKDRATVRVTASLEALKAKYGDRLRVMSGMAEGFDELLAMIAIRLNIKLIAAIPNKGYSAYYWSLCPDETERNLRLAGTPAKPRLRGSLTGTNRMSHFNGITARADKVINVMEDVHGIQRGLYLNGRHSNFLRNDYMVAQANHFLVWDPSSSGTKDCFTSIREAKKSFEILSTDADGASTPGPVVPTMPVEPGEAV